MDVLLINDILKIPTTGFSDYEKKYERYGYDYTAKQFKTTHTFL